MLNFLFFFLKFFHVEIIFMVVIKAFNKWQCPDALVDFVNQSWAVYCFSALCVPGGILTVV